MEAPGLYELIVNLEYGSKLHIGVVFPENGANEKCILPHEHTIHSSPICDFFKNIPGGFAKCLQCRKCTIQRAEDEKKPFWAYCVHGVLEYTAPVVMLGRVVAIVFVGNILTPEGEGRMAPMLGDCVGVLESMEETVSEQRVETVAGIVSSYIMMLLEKYPDKKAGNKSIIENVKAYVLANLEYDLKLSDIAELFFYNEVYLGRLFKKEVGESFKDYVNGLRIRRATELLETELSITEISERVGYTGVSYFNRVFKARLGLSPTEYRAGRLP